MNHTQNVAVVLCTIALLGPGAILAPAQFSQQGPKLVGTGAGGVQTYQGMSVDISDDGNTAIVGGPGDNTAAGATWVFVRKGGIWSQVGGKLVGSGATMTNAYQGRSVAISGDGNTIIVGAPNDDNYMGSAFVFVRSGEGWQQQGPKLVGTGGVGETNQGTAVSLSADGNTAAVSGVHDNNFHGATWIFVRENGVWNQQGEKLVGTGPFERMNQGSSVALSGDGNTLLVGGPTDSTDVGAAWVFTRTGGVWAQQGSRLVGTNAIFAVNQGSAVAISYDGNTAMIGGPGDNYLDGAAWIFTRTGGIWTQQGEKLVGTGAIYQTQQGKSVALSGDGNTAMLGGPGDSTTRGSLWFFRRENGVWTQYGNKLLGSDGSWNAHQGQAGALSGDGNTAIIGGFFDQDYVGAAWIFVERSLVVTVDGAGPQAIVRLFDPGGTLVEERQTDALAQTVFRAVAPGSGYAYDVLYVDPDTAKYLDTTYLGRREGITLIGGRTVTDFFARNAPSVVSTDVRDGITHEPLPGGKAYVGRPVEILLSVRNPGLSTGLPLLVSTRLVLDTNGVAPYAYELQAGPQLIQADTTHPFTFPFTPDVPRVFSYGAAVLANVEGTNRIADWQEGSKLFEAVLPPLPVAPVLVMPADGAGDLPVALPLVWRTVPLATSYRLRLGTDSTFLEGMLLDTLLADTIRTVSGLAFRTTYYWSVEALNVTGTGPGSPVRRFRTLEADPSIPILLYPAHRATGIDTPATIRWSRPAGATQYSVQVARDSGFTLGLQTSSTVDSSQVLRPLAFLTTYWWRVRAVFPGSASGPFSLPRAFTTGLPLPPAVVLLFPEDNFALTADTLLVRWAASGPAVDRYCVEYSIDSLFTVKWVDSLVTDTSLVLRSLSTNVWYRWHVRARNAAGWGPFSVARRFGAWIHGTDGSETSLPSTYVFEQNYPNPFNPATRLRFGLPARSPVILAIYNSLGQHVVDLVNAELDAGYYEVVFDAQFRGERGLSSGVYFARLHAGRYLQTRKLLLTR